MMPRENNGDDEEYATRRSSAALTPDSPDSSNSIDGVEEPFLSSLTFVEEQRQRLDDQSSVSSTSSRFRCEPRLSEWDDGNNGDGSPDSRNSQRSADLARRFLAETSFDPDEEMNDFSQIRSNADRMSFASFGHDSQKSIWEQHSERHPGAVDQSVNLMDMSATVYDDEPTKLEAALKDPFSFLLKSSSSSASGTPTKSREAKPLVEIDLNDRASKHSSSNFRKTSSTKSEGKLKGLGVALLFCLISVISLWAASEHGQKLVLDDTVPSDNSEMDVGDGSLFDTMTTTATLAAKGAVATSVTKGATATEVSKDVDPSGVSSPDEEDEGTDASEVSFSEEESGEEGESEDKNASEAFSPGGQESSEEVEGEEEGLQEAGEEDDVPLLDTSQVPEDGSRMDAIQYFLEELGVSDAADFKKIGSAAYQALKWISEDDSAQLVIPGYDTSPGAHDWEYLSQLLQRYALALLYFEMEFDVDQTKVEESQAMSSEEAQNNRLEFDLKWTLADSVCGWPGVTCQEDHQVVALNLTHTILQGTLPKEILAGVALPHLSSLDLSHNKIHGSLPDVAASAGNNRKLLTTEESSDKAHPLIHLQLNHNHISGNLDPLTNFRSLAFADISYNRFGGQIPDSLAELSHLEYLSLYTNTFAGTIPSSLGTLVNLASLFLDDNRLSGTVPTSLGDLEQLEQLRLLENRITGSVPTEICHLFSEASMALLIADCSVSCDCCTRCWNA